MNRYHLGLLVVIAVGFVFYVLLIPTLADSRQREIDCGPEGKPALNGTACIDRNPVTITE